MNLTQWLQSRMDGKGLSQNKLAQQAGIDQSTISKLLSGKSNNPTIGLLMKIFKVVGNPPKNVSWVK